MCTRGVIRFCISLKKTFFDSFTFKMITEYGNGAVVQIATVFGPVYHLAFQRVLFNGTFQAYIQPRFSESLISEIQQLWGSYFFWKCSKFNADSENAKKRREKDFCFCDNCIWSGCIKLSLLRREYLSLADNVLTNSYNVLRITKRDIFRLIYLQNDH